MEKMFTIGCLLHDYLKRRKKIYRPHRRSLLKKFQKALILSLWEGQNRVISLNCTFFNFGALCGCLLRLVVDDTSLLSLFGENFQPYYRSDVANPNWDIIHFIWDCIQGWNPKKCASNAKVNVFKCFFSSGAERGRANVVQFFHFLDHCLGIGETSPNSCLNNG